MFSLKMDNDKSKSKVEIIFCDNCKIKRFKTELFLKLYKCKRNYIITEDL